MLRRVLVILWVAACSKEGGGGSKRPPDAAPVVAPPPPDAAPPVDAPPAEPSTRVEGQVKRGDMIIKILERNGVRGTDGQELIEALKGVLDFKKLQPGQRYVLVHRKGKVLEFELQVTEAATVKAVRGPDGKLSAEAI
jgi:hypothetical protein